MSNTEVTPEMIHDRLYYVAKSVIAVLEKHDIPYSLAYGTLLGAVRHQGFIPWDDDFDLWLFAMNFRMTFSLKTRSPNPTIFTAGRMQRI